MILEISTHGSYLKRKHDVFVITNSEIKTEIPAEKVESIIITANASISTHAIQLCIEKEIQLVIAEWSGRPIGRFWVSTPGKSTEIRRMQYANMNSDTGLEISKEIVGLKLKRQRRLLSELKNNRPTTIPYLESAIQSIGDIITKFNNKALLDKPTLLGLEGSCATQYFKAISACLPKKWRFEQRSQNPALDEFNSVLNYTYSLGYSTVEKIIILSGLDPNAGFYHADSYGKPTLSFDLIELSRPSMDRTVISLFTKKKAKDDWFEINDVSKKLGIYLSKDARRAIISDFSEKNKKAIERDSWNFCRHMIEKISENTK
ncbi:CRISPR-associated endonuclease Cas1 [Candidatus Nitrosotenuis uzonensis]|uniref:CRISPR-associated endonuclease Cas1 n=1 Tax=Candidatus Nitrosotenuis uzonensis TaxID=1407055 RepID=A0A812EZS9_9ARCH|nr:CRISPR-associated endonuclease Cas1 [Candidatus Nitrosotenuis uzonensis]CAE6493535.1 CRISPR-associated endonuclease Cas1 [Candidatus Nitrosotenuis uzonensis]